jgi:polysaccharide export outer membrane protein
MLNFINFIRLYLLTIRMKRIIIYLISLIVLSFLASCAPVVKNPSSGGYAEAQSRPYPEREYKIQVGDQLDIKFYYNSELNEQVIVRPDGRISLQLVHEIIAAGLSPAQLTTLLTEKYAAELEKPELTVIIRSFSTQRVYIDGEVSRPGLVNLTGFMTVLQGISQAGGLKETARIHEAIVIRRQADNTPYVMTVDLEKAIDGTDTSQDIALMPLDIVYLPKSHIANINQWVDQYVRRMLPIPFYFGANISP